MLKKTSQISNALHTFLNPFAGATSSSYIWKPQGFAPTGNRNWDKLLFKTLALSSTYGTAAFLLKSMANKRAENERKKKEAIVGESLQASNPIISPDPDLTDIEKEKTLVSEGLTKRAQDNLITWPIKKIFGGLGSAVKPTTGADAWTLTIPAVAAIMATGGGIYAADRINISKRKADAQKRLETAMNEMDALNNAKLMIARGKEPEGMDKLLRTSSVQKEAQASDFKNVMWAIAALTAASSGTLGFMATKEFMDRRDPKRIKQKLLNEELRKAELKQGLGTPQISLDISPEEREALDSPNKGLLAKKLLSTRPATAAISTEPASARPPIQRDLLTL